MRNFFEPTRAASKVPGVALAVAVAGFLPAAADVTNPERVANLRLARVGNDVVATWDAVTLDVTGSPEAVSQYNVYSGTVASFVPDKDLGTNLLGAPSSEEFTHAGGAIDGIDHFYLVSAVDTSGNEGLTRAPRVTTPPVLSGHWTSTTVEVDWTAALPSSEVQGYRVYFGRNPGQYEDVDDVGPATSHSLTGLETLVNWYVAVTAVDSGGNESAFSNQHVDAVAGVVEVQAEDQAALCWGSGNCPPRPGEIQQSNGQTILVPVAFPEGDWVSVQLTFTAHSGLWSNPNPPWNVTTKCGDTNPGTGWNPGGDPWDRTASVFLVEDDCLSECENEPSFTCTTDADCGRCVLNPAVACQTDAHCGTEGPCDTSVVSCGRHCFGRDDNVELIRTITPFGTDDVPPAGDGVVPPRVWTYDITPLAPLLTGTKYVGAHISVFVTVGWDVWASFRFSEDPADAPDLGPADGIVQAIFQGGGGSVAVPRQVSIPPTAQQVIGRVFVTGHGGNQACDGGANDGQSCTTGCPGGSCQNCDEFCHRQHNIRVDGNVGWSVVPWRNDCSPGGPLQCRQWNSCGTCSFPRAGWCPGYRACHHEDPCSNDIDFTASLTPGATHDVTWEIPVVAGSWTKSVLFYWYDTPQPFCGNDVIEGSELCDTTDVGTASCQDLGWDGGTLLCNAVCDGYDESMCRDFFCGNDICEPAAGEDCVSCDLDCNGKQNGPASGRYCCGDGGGQNPVGCADPRCTADGNTCEP
jgi:hypothetical protein